MRRARPATRPSGMLVILVSLVVWTLAACDDDDSGPSNADSGVRDVGLSDQRPDQAVDAGACPATTSGPTEHTSRVTADETWTALGSPHVVRGLGTLTVSNATLTIEPCAVVEVDEGVKISVDEGGQLIAEGEASRPITFTALGDATWGNLRVQHPGYISLAHVRIDSAGEDVATYDGASLVVWGDNAPPLKEVAKVADVTVSGSAGYGVLVGRWGGFTADSSALTVTGSGAASLADCPSAGVAECSEPLHVSSQSLGTIPQGSYTGNARDEVLVDPVGGIEYDLTIRDRGVPYHVSGLVTGGLNVARAASRPSDGVPTLTLEAGVTIRFDPDSVLRIGFNTSPGALQVAGTAGSPVVLTSSAPSPAAGDWRGVWFDTAPDPASNAIAHARVEYAGGRAVGSGFSCPTEDGSGTLLDEDAAITFHYRPQSALVTNSTVSQSAGHGIVRGWTADSTGPDFTGGGNSFDQVAHCPQTNPKPSTGVCTSQVCP